MQNNFFCNYPYINIFENPSNNSKISSQIIYGEKFKVLKKVKNFLKIRTSYDRYHGYIKNKKFKKKIIWAGSKKINNKIFKIKKLPYWKPKYSTFEDLTNFIIGK